MLAATVVVFFFLRVISGDTVVSIDSSFEITVGRLIMLMKFIIDILPLCCFAANDEAEGATVVLLSSFVDVELCLRIEKK